MTITLEDISVFILGGALFLGLWLVFGMVMKSWLSSYFWCEKIKYIHKFKIPEKYKSKVSPIYELCESDWETDRLVIKKWSLKFYEKEKNQILSVFLIYPIEFLSYGYQLEDAVFLCYKKDTESIGGTLEENYERIWGKENEQYLTEKAEKDKQKSKIKDLNQIFDENYE
jgi:hypothetical protein